MNKQIMMKEGSVLYAARFIAEHNHYLKDYTFKELEESINETVGHVYQKAMEAWEWNSCSTGGWKVLFYPQSEECGLIEIMVDPSVSTNSNYNYI